MGIPNIIVAKKVESLDHSEVVLVRAVGEDLGASIW